MQSIDTLLSSSVLGYTVIAILGFLLGCCVTILCKHIKGMKEESRDK